MSTNASMGGGAIHRDLFEAGDQIGGAGQAAHDQLRGFLRFVQKDIEILLVQLLHQHLFFNCIGSFL